MGKIDEALAIIQTQEDTTERALLLGGVISTLMRIRDVELILVGDLAYDCYVNNTNNHADLLLCVLEGQMTPRLIQEVMVEELHAKGRIWQWELLGVTIRFVGQAITSFPELCREFKTDYGIARLIPAEELVAERVLCAVYPELDESARAEARRVLALAEAEAFIMDWNVLHSLCDSETFNIGGDLAALRLEAKDEVQRAVAEAAEKNAREAEPMESVPSAEFETGDAYEPVEAAADVTGLRTDTGRLPPPPMEVPLAKRETTHLPEKGVITGAVDA